MLFLSGGLTPLARNIPGIGMMLSPNKGNRGDLLGLPWAADNGAFGGKYKGDDVFLRWLDKRDRMHCLFAVAPDVVCDAAATWQQSAPMLPRIRALGYKPCLALQNGFDAGVVDWSLVDAVLIGGDDDFKLGPEGREAIAAALAHGCWVHMGRVNSWPRLHYAHKLGCQSVDGTTIAFNPGRYTREIAIWLRRLDAPQMRLFACGGGLIV